MIASYTLQMTFGQWLKQKRTDARISGVELERRSGVSRQYISNLERELLSDIKQQPITPSIEFVEKLAKALGADPDEARLAAGYAPLNTRPVTAKDVFDILNRIPGFEGILASEDITDENAQRILDDFLTVIELHKARKDR